MYMILLSNRVNKVFIKLNILECTISHKVKIQDGNKIPVVIYGSTCNKLVINKKRINFD